MTVRVIFHQGDILPESLLVGNTPETDFGLVLSSQHTVYAVCMRQTVVHYLILNLSNYRPDWYPACLFEIIDGKLPWGWHIVRAGTDAGLPVEFLLGYDELAQADGKHYVDLIERVPEALAIFERQRELIDGDDD